jgi:hypothetical protein
VRGTWRCSYCGALGAKIRRPGEPPTCYTCRDLPAVELEREAETDELLKRYYAGGEPSE